MFALQGSAQHRLSSRVRTPVHRPASSRGCATIKLVLDGCTPVLTWPGAHAHVSHLNLLCVVVEHEGHWQAARGRCIAKQQVRDATGALQWKTYLICRVAGLGVLDDRTRREAATAHLSWDSSITLAAAAVRGQRLTWPGYQDVRMAPTRSDCCSQDTSSGPPWISSTTICAFVYLPTACTTAPLADSHGQSLKICRSHCPDRMPGWHVLNHCCHIDCCIKSSTSKQQSHRCRAGRTFTRSSCAPGSFRCVRSSISACVRSHQCASCRL